MAIRTAGQVRMSGERALEGGSVGARTVRREHELDRQLEQRAQRLEDLLGRHAFVRPIGRELEARPRSMSVSPDRDQSFADTTRCAKTQSWPSGSVAVNRRSPAGDSSRSVTSAPASVARA